MLLYNPDFLNNKTDTGFIERNLDMLLRPVEGDKL
jgi:hypothetical protein